MKAIIYAGIGLFSVASVYGVADYYNSKKSGELKKLYVEEKVPVVVPAEEEKTVEVIPVKNVETTAAETKAVTAKVKSPKKVKKVEKKLRFENFSRARIPEPVVIEDTITTRKIKQQD
jgi:predicted nucleic acid-binding OB-fold protein